MVLTTAAPAKAPQTLPTPPTTAMKRYSIPNLMPNGEGFTVRCRCAKSQPDTDASSAAITNIVTLVRKVFTPIASGIVVPPPRFRFSARITRPGRESSRWLTRTAPAIAAIQISQKILRPSWKLRPKSVIGGTPRMPSYLPSASRLPIV